MVEEYTYLIVYNKLWVFVEHWILSLSQGTKLCQKFSWVETLWSGIHNSVRFFQHLLHVNCITVMKEVLQNNLERYFLQIHIFD